MKKIIEKLEELLEAGGMKKDAIFLIISGISLVFSFINSHFNIIGLPFDIAYVAVILCGLPIILEAIIGLISRFDIKADVLVAAALIASIIIREDFAAGEVAFIMKLGEFLEEITVARARSGIEKLVKLTPAEARVIRDGKELMLSVEQIVIGDIIKILPGEIIPVDGEVISGESSVNQSVMTGEALPVDVSAGSSVLSGSINLYGSFDMKAKKLCADSSAQRMVELVKSADAGKAKIVGFADKFATIVVVLAFSAALLTYITAGEIIRAVTILVVFCPCALVIATPAAISAAIGNATKHGFLIKEGDALERLANVDTLTFDKTGTLTYGELEVKEIKSVGNYSENEILSLCAFAESRSEHPLAKAILKAYSGKITNPENVIAVPGKGIVCTISGKSVVAGNAKFMYERGIDISSLTNDTCYTAIYLGIEGTCEGYIYLGDREREDSRQTILKLQNKGIKTVLLTGDNGNVAENTAQKLGIDEYRAECLPEDKLNYIKYMQEQNGHICMIGDGINDAPSLKCADVGIAMAEYGSDIAVDASDIALVDGGIKMLPHLLSLSKRMMTTIKINMTFSMALNFVAIILAAIGSINPIIGALIHNTGSVLVILNSALLLGWKEK